MTISFYQSKAQNSTKLEQFKVFLKILILRKLLDFVEEIFHG